MYTNEPIAHLSSALVYHDNLSLSLHILDENGLVFDKVLVPCEFCRSCLVIVQPISIFDEMNSDEIKLSFCFLL